MLATAYYFLQVVICSGLMMGYYWLVLRNKRFHQYNRFYLLAITLLAWIVPLVKIQFNHQQAENDPQLMQLLALLANNNARIEQTVATQGIDWKNLAVIGLYGLITLVLLLGMIRALLRIYQLLKTHSCKNVGEVYLILTQAKGTPFSFFRYIFWNEEIDIKSDAGRQILKHELTHVQQKHSIDKMFIQLVLIAGWFNPFFWLIKREMEMIHEFIADKKAVSNGDTASLAQMLLTAAYPNQHFALTHPFFFSPIKRRLAMLTNNSKPRFSYIRRLVVLPLLAIVIVLFAFRNKEQRVNATISVADVIENIREDLTPTRINLAPAKVATRFPANSKQAALALKAALNELGGEQVGVDTVILNHMVDKPIKAGIQGVLNNVLVFVDGERTSNQVLQTMDPNSIKDITILKDPKVLSVYGKEGKNGVVLINTKNAAGASLKYDSRSLGDEVTVVASKSYPGGPGQPTIVASSIPLNGTISGGTFSGTLAKPVFGAGKNYSFVGVKDTVVDINLKPQPAFFLDGIKVPSGSLSSIDPADIAHISVLKPPYSTNKYGEEGKNGVIDVYTTASGKMPITTLGNLQAVTVTGRLIPAADGRVRISGVAAVQNLTVTGVKNDDNHK